MRSQPGKQPVCLPASGRCSCRRRRTRADAPRRGARAGARGALAPGRARRRAGRSVAAAGLPRRLGIRPIGTRPEHCGDGVCAHDRVAEPLGELVPRRLDRCPLPRGAGTPGAVGCFCGPETGQSSLRGLCRGVGRKRLRSEGRGSAARGSRTVPPTTEGGIRDPRKNVAQGGAWEARRR